MSRKIVDDDLLRQMWAEGETCQAIANVFGCTKAAISGRARKIKLPSRKRAVLEDNKRFRRVWRESRTITQAAAKLGFSRSAVLHAAVRFGYPGVGQTRSDARAVPDPAPVKVARCAEVGDRVGGGAATDAQSPEAKLLAEVLQTGGRYRALCDLAQRHDKPFIWAQQQWHRSRVAA